MNVVAQRVRTMLAMLVAASGLAGCATTRVTEGAPSPARPLVVPAAAGERAVSQIVRGAFNAREFTLSCVVSLKDGTMNVVGLNAMGVRLFTVSYDGKLVEVEKGLAAPDAITPERLLADLQLVFWPLQSLQKVLRPAGYELNEPAPGTRRLRRADRLVAEVHYADGGAADSGIPAWPARAWLVSLEFGYTLQIDTQAP